MHPSSVFFLPLPQTGHSEFYVICYPSQQIHNKFMKKIYKQIQFGKPDKITRGWEAFNVNENNHVTVTESYFKWQCSHFLI